jgi:hypothetical protein
LQYPTLPYKTGNHNFRSISIENLEHLPLSKEKYFNLFSRQTALSLNYDLVKAYDGELKLETGCAKEASSL